MAPYGSCAVKEQIADREKTNKERAGREEK